MISVYQKNSRRLIHLLALSTVVFIVALTTKLAFAASATLYISPSASEFNIGDIVKLDIIENSGEDHVNAVKANLTYPADKLEFIEIINSEVFNIHARSEGGSGSVQIDRGALPPVKGKQTVASVRFLVKKSGTATVSFSDGSAVTSGSKNILGVTSGGVYNLKDKKANLKPSLPPEEAEASPPPSLQPTLEQYLTPPSNAIDNELFFSRSDFNKSELVDVFDLTILLNNYFSNVKSLDINKDGDINSIDLSVLLSNYDRVK